MTISENPSPPCLLPPWGSDGIHGVTRYPLRVPDFFTLPGAAEIQQHR